MPAFASWFRVHARQVLAQVDVSIHQLGDPAYASSVIDLASVGLDTPAFRMQLALARGALADALTAQALADDRLQAARGERALAAKRFFAWRGRLFARLRLAARQGADPERTFSTVFGYRRVPQVRAAGLVAHGESLFSALSARSASLSNRGVGAPFVAEGRALYRALVELHAEVDEVTSHRKRETAAVQEAVVAVRELLLILVAADDAAALEVGRAPMFGLDVLRPSNTHEASDGEA